VVPSRALGGRFRDFAGPPVVGTLAAMADSTFQASVAERLKKAEPGSTRDRVTKEYATEEIVVEWEPRLCYHSRNCVRLLPQVFDATRRPWVDVEAATADEVEAAVAQCPSGALRTRRAGAAVATHKAPRQIRVSVNGPLLLSGGVRIVDAEGNLLYEGERAALCRCGGSANKPFCDGTHEKNGFRG
jgi:uncharacterized Fe-S cluster protein YjdI